MKRIITQVSDSFARRSAAWPDRLLWMEFALATMSGAVLAAILAAKLGPMEGVGLALGGFGLGALVAGAGLRRSYPHAEFGVCNLITLTRLALTAALAAPLVAAGPPTDAVLWLAFGIAASSLLLDGVDGWAARRAGLASGFGARFDMEVDSAFALLLAVLAWQTGQAGVWVLVLGLPRYAFLAAGAIWPQLTRPVPDSLFRKTACVLQIGALVAFLVPTAPAALTVPAAMLAALALSWSFLRDVRMLLSRPE